MTTTAAASVLAWFGSDQAQVGVRGFLPLPEFPTMAAPPPPLSVFDAVRLFKALADLRRLRLLLLLAERGPLSLSALRAAAGQPLPTVANQLRILRMTGLVRSRRQGQLAVYSLASNHVRYFLRVVHGGELPRGQPGGGRTRNASDAG